MLVDPPLEPNPVIHVQDELCSKTYLLTGLVVTG